MRECTIKSVIFLIVDIDDTCSAFHDRFMQASKLLEKLLHSKKYAHITFESEAGSRNVSTYFFRYVPLPFL